MFCRHGISVPHPQIFTVGFCGFSPGLSLPSLKKLLRTLQSVKLGVGAGCI